MATGEVDPMASAVLASRRPRGLERPALPRIRVEGASVPVQVAPFFRAAHPILINRDPNVTRFEPRQIQWTGINHMHKLFGA